MKPFLKWAGGKRQLHPFIIPIIEENLSSDNTYFEPFVGAGSVFLELEHKNVVINDTNSDLMLCYEMIKYRSTELINELNIHQENHCKDYYYNVRLKDRNEFVYNDMTLVERAARVIYLNKTCFNGLYRVNKKGQFNTPFGAHNNPSIYNENNLIQISSYMITNNVDIRNLDFEEAVKDATKGDFIYFDPPYDYEDKGFSSYQKEGFNHFDLVRLKNVCDSLIDKGCHVLISNHATKKVIDLFSEENYEMIDLNYSIDYINVKRYIGSRIEYRKNAQEVLIHGWKK